MTNLKATKKALVSSVLALVMCFTMLLGTTFAWFTDSVTSSGNVIQAGKLDVELYKWNDTVDAEHANATAISESSEPIFGKADSTTANANTADTLWEPGKTQTVYLSIKNNGTLDLKYKVALEVTNITNGLNEVLTYVINNDVQYGGLEKTDLPADWSNCSKVVSGINIATEDVALEAGAEHFFALSVHMDELAGNEYQNGNITFNIKVLAGQLASEEDSFDNQYDADAIYPEISGASVPVESNKSFYELEVREKGNHNAIATAVILAGSVGADVSELTFNAEKVDTYQHGNIVVEGASEALTYDLSVGGLKSNNDIAVKVELRIPEGLDPQTVKVYHYGDEIAAVYNHESGFVSFETTSFSPFTIVFDPTSEWNDSAVLPEGIPTATVTDITSTIDRSEIVWKDAGDFSPNYDVDPDPQLEGIFKFVCNETAEEAELNDYADWYCDFYVKLDRDLGGNQIFLGGNYGEFGWIGFHNGEITLAANEEIALLGSVTQNPWTYAQIASFVGEFICGVGDVNNSLSGATFTVMLRLTNPENEAEFYNVAVIPFTFQ